MTEGTRGSLRSSRDAAIGKLIRGKAIAAPGERCTSAPTCRSRRASRARRSAGTVVGYRFEQLADMVKGSAHPDRLGICVDTCHTFAAGYDFRTRDGYEALLRTIDQTVGLGRIRAFHLNDSVGDLGSNLDRHEDIGKGKLGKEAFRFLVNEERFRELPGCLEFPGADAGYRRNLKALRSLVTGTNPPTAGPRPSGKRAGRGTA